MTRWALSLMCFAVACSSDDDSGRRVVPDSGAATGSGGAAAGGGDSGSQGTDSCSMAGSCAGQPFTYCVEVPLSCSTKTCRLWSYACGSTGTTSGYVASDGEDFPCVGDCPTLAQTAAGHCCRASP